MRIEPKKIMCAIDFSDFSNMVLSYGISLAAQLDSALCICHVVSGSYMVASHISPYADYSGIEAARIQHAEEKLAQLRDKFDLNCDIIVASGYPAEEISRIACDNDIGMVIAATHGGSGVRRFLIGSVTDRLVKILPCPLLVLNSTESDQTRLLEKKVKIDRILVGCDFSSDSQLAFDYAVGLAQEFQTQLHIAHVVRPAERLDMDVSETVNIHGENVKAWNMADYEDFKKESSVWDNKREQPFFKNLETKLSKMVPEECRHWCTPIVVILEGSPYKELISYVREKQVDMVVLGIHGHSLWESFLVGSTTDRIIGRSPCPVLAVRKSGSVKPHEKETAVQEVSYDSIQTARDIMETSVISIRPDTDIISAAQILLENHINGVPVVDKDDNLKGILCQSDLIFQQKKISIPSVFSFLDGIIPLSSSKQMDEEFKKIAAVTADQAMAEDPVTVHPDMPISEIASLMVEKHFHTIPVVDKNRLVGIIGKEDILKILVHS